MISSFFSTTKPVNYMVLYFLLFLFYSTHLFFDPARELTYAKLPLELLTFAVLGLSIFIVNQIVQAGKVTGANSYTLLFFVLLLGTFSSTLSIKNIIFSNFFLLLALWRLLAIKSMKNIKHKIFDASFLVSIASLFYDWALLFLILVFFVIKIYDSKTFKNWLVPFVALTTVFVLAFTILKLYNALPFFKEHYQFSISGLVINTIQPKTLSYILLMLGIITVVFVRVRKISGGKLVVLRIVFFTFILGIAINLMTPAGTSPLLITFFPAALFMANALEALKKKKLREAILSLSIILPFLLFAL